MKALLLLHEYCGGAFVLACLVAGLWALDVSRRRRKRNLPPAYWLFLRRVVAGLFGLQIVTGFLLLALRAPLPISLHWLYAVLILLGIGGAEMLRPGSQLRAVFASTGPFDEARTYWMLLLFVALLAMRAFTTGRYGF